MKAGTKSLLFGAHQFVLHPLCVAIAWKRLFGFPLDPRLWAAFVVHDWGYWGLSNMDGYEGKFHPYGGAKIMSRLFGPSWGNFTACHSRSYASFLGRPPSALCAADKLATAVMPTWLYVVLVLLTGEYREYIGDPYWAERGHRLGTGRNLVPSVFVWAAAMKAYFRDQALLTKTHVGGNFSVRKIVEQY